MSPCTQYITKSFFLYKLTATQCFSTHFNTMVTIANKLWHIYQQWWVECNETVHNGSTKTYTSGATRIQINGLAYTVWSLAGFRESQSASVFLTPGMCWIRRLYSVRQRAHLSNLWFEVRDAFNQASGWWSQWTMIGPVLMYTLNACRPLIMASSSNSTME